MRRIFIASIQGGYVEITEREHKHLSVVLRAKGGDALSLCCGDGFVYDGVIQKIERDRTVVKIVGKAVDAAEPRIICDLYLGIIKGEHLEIAVQKSVELGVKNIYPLVTQHAVKTGVNLERLDKIVLDAAKQCGRGALPKAHAPQKIGDAYKDLKQYDLVVFPYEKAETKGIRQFLDSAKINNEDNGDGGKKIKNIAVVVGPEGGFSAEEADNLSKITVPVSLGARILRADTAAIAAIAAIMYELGEMTPPQKAQAEKTDAEKTDAKKTDAEKADAEKTDAKKNKPVDNSDNKPDKKSDNKPDNKPVNKPVKKPAEKNEKTSKRGKNQ